MIIRYADGVQFEVTGQDLEERVALGPEVVKDVAQSFEDVLETQIKPAVVKVVNSLKAVSPRDIEVEFGIKMSAGVGAVFSKAGVEGHLTVKLKWSVADEARQNG